VEKTLPHSPGRNLFICGLKVFRLVFNLNSIANLFLVLFRIFVYIIVYIQYRRNDDGEDSQSI